jgi:flagellar biogenesis protein FliO
MEDDFIQLALKMIFSILLILFLSLVAFGYLIKLISLLNSYIL